MQKKVIGYIRISTDLQDLERQRALIAEYCALHNYLLVKIICDNGISGSIAERDGYIELLTTKKEDADFVVMTAVSRFSRQEDITEPLYHINNTLKKGISIVFLENNIYNTKVLEGGRHLSMVEVITLAVSLSAAAEERKSIVGTMMSGRRQKFADFQGMCIGRVPFGYERQLNPDYVMNKTPKSFIVRNENAEVVKQIFQWVIDGHTLMAIALRLQQRDVKTNKGEDISFHTLAVIIHNPIYKGEWTFSGKTIQGDAIVTPEVWDKAQLALQNNRISTIIRNVNFNPLKGLLKCPCGKSMYIISNRTKANPYHKQYRCAAKKNKYDETICANGGTDVDLTIEVVWHAIKCADVLDFLTMNNSEVLRIDGRIQDIDNEIANINDKIDAINNDMVRLANNIAIVDNESLMKVLVSKYEAFENEVKRLKSNNQQLAKDKVGLLKLREEITNSDAIKDNVSIEEKATIFHRLLSKVVYYSEVMHRGFLVVTFKNGLEIIYLLMTSRKTKAVQIPPGMSFDTVSRKIIVEVKLSDGLETEKVAYDSFTFANTFPDIMEEGRI